MAESKAKGNKDQLQDVHRKFSEVTEFNHKRNQVAQAQKQMASQETTGVLDQE
ncbi:hypothetical protein [Paenibacillus caui]|uniref:hypothetical protein n=1 Tax=Paenibacillus caui TaxID=2873927 RepID=UPI001CA89485|nr:hypothetical protein [Paenibacillus caui]